MDDDKIYYDWHQIERWSERIVLDLLKTDWRPDYIVGLTRGGLTPAVIMSHMLDIPMLSLDVSLRDGTLGPTSNCWIPEDVTNGKRILIVDDINDTGASLAWIRDDWHASVAGVPGVTKDLWWHDRVKVAVIVNNLASAENVDFCATEINKDEDPRWVVFPWER
jgi:uncharacterized protein